MVVNETQDNAVIKKIEEIYAKEAGIEKVYIDKEGKITSETVDKKTSEEEKRIKKGDVKEFLLYAKKLEDTRRVVEGIIEWKQRMKNRAIGRIVVFTEPIESDTKVAVQFDSIEEGKKRRLEELEVTHEFLDSLKDIKGWLEKEEVKVVQITPDGEVWVETEKKEKNIGKISSLQKNNIAMKAIRVSNYINDNMSGITFKNSLVVKLPEVHIGTERNKKIEVEVECVFTASGRIVNMKLRKAIFP